MGHHIDIEDRRVVFYDDENRSVGIACPDTLNVNYNLTLPNAVPSANAVPVVGSNGEMTWLYLQDQGEGDPQFNTQLTTYVSKGTPETRTSTTTLATDSTLQFNVVAGATYYLDIRIIWGGTGGIKWGLIGGTGTAELVAPSLATSFLELIAGNMPLDNSAGNANIIFRTGTLKATGTGTIVFQWAQNSSDPAGTTLNASTAIEIRKVSA